MNDCGDHCITCSDDSVPMQVVAVRQDTAVCVDDKGAEHEVAVELVEPVVPGDRLLVHAGVAIA